MKRMFTLTLVLIACFSAYAHDVDAREIVANVEYREETELVSVVSHLAEVPGYAWDAEDDGMAEYSAEVDSVFAAYKDHEAVAFARELIDTGFAWHVPNAVSLQYKLVDGQLVAIDELKPEGDLHENISQKNEEELLLLLQKFYDDTDFHRFFIAHKALYTECEEAMREVVDLIDFNWYNTFFATKGHTQVNINVGLLNGPGNFAALQHGRDGMSVVNALMGCCARDENGKVYYGVHYTLPVILHECNHSYCNPLNEEFWDEIKDNATKLYNTNPKFYTSLAYGNPQYLMNETFVEACVIRYLLSHDVDLHGFTTEDFIQIDDEHKRFLMIRNIIDVLGEYEANAGKYTSMRDFMPRYAEVVRAFKVPEITDKK